MNKVCDVPNSFVLICIVVCLERKTTVIMNSDFYYSRIEQAIKNIKLKTLNLLENTHWKNNKRRKKGNL